MTFSCSLLIDDPGLSYSVFVKALHFYDYNGWSFLDDDHPHYPNRVGLSYKIFEKQPIVIWSMAKRSAMEQVNQLWQGYYYFALSMYLSINRVTSFNNGQNQTHIIYTAIIWCTVIIFLFGGDNNSNKL